jgi:hypothetical protein
MRNTVDAAIGLSVDQATSLALGDVKKLDTRDRETAQELGDGVCEIQTDTNVYREPRVNVISEHATDLLTKKFMGDMWRTMLASP